MPHFAKNAVAVLASACGVAQAHISSGVAWTGDWKVALQNMRKLPISDAAMRSASIRPDGRLVHDMYMFQGKIPNESKGEWDHHKLLAAIPAQITFKPLEGPV